MTYLFAFIYSVIIIVISESLHFVSQDNNEARCNNFNVPLFHKRLLQLLYTVTFKFGVPDLKTPVHNFSNEINTSTDFQIERSLRFLEKILSGMASKTKLVYLRK